MAYTYPHPRPAVTCDAVVFTMRSNDLAILLIKRKDEPFKNHWALPGGFVNENEPLERAAARELDEETGLSGVKLEQLGAFGDPGRDPRGHVVTVAWLTFLVAEPRIAAADDAAAAEWHSFRTLSLNGISSSRSIPPPPTRGKRVTATAKATKTKIKTGGTIPLAFDHARIISRGYRRLCQHLDNPLAPRPFELLPPRFTIADLQRFYEVVLGRSFSPRAFKSRLLEQGLVVPATSKPAPKPSAQLYRWNKSR